MASPVIDLSHHNPDPDWAAVKAAGVLGVIHKATEGAGYADPDRRPRLAAAYRAGLLIATYHFMRPGDMAAQVAFYLKTIDAAKGERVILDYEDPKIPVSDLRDAVQAIWDARPDLQITVYSGNLIKEQLGNASDPLLAKTSLWIAQYNNSGPRWPTQVWPNWSLWQWTDSETVPGISRPVDGNKWNGTADSLARWLAPAQG
jgi:lysozyme